MLMVICYHSDRERIHWLRVFKKQCQGLSPGSVSWRPCDLGQGMQLPVPQFPHFHNGNTVLPQGAAMKMTWINIYVVVKTMPAHYRHEISISLLQIAVYYLWRKKHRPSGVQYPVLRKGVQSRARTRTQIPWVLSGLVLSYYNATLPFSYQNPFSKSKQLIIAHALWESLAMISLYVLRPFQEKSNTDRGPHVKSCVFDDTAV